MHAFVSPQRPKIHLLLFEELVPLSPNLCRAPDNEIHQGSGQLH